MRRPFLALPASLTPSTSVSVTSSSPDLWTARGGQSCGRRAVGLGSGVVALWQPLCFQGRGDAACGRSPKGGAREPGASRSRCLGVVGQGTLGARWPSPPAGSSVSNTLSRAFPLGESTWDQSQGRHFLEEERARGQVPRDPVGARPGLAGWPPPPHVPAEGTWQTPLGSVGSRKGCLQAMCPLEK